MGSNMVYDRNRALTDLPVKCSARCSERACTVAPFATLIKICISFGLDFFVYALMRSRMLTTSLSLKLFLCNCVSMSVLKLFLTPLS